MEDEIFEITADTSFDDIKDAIEDELQEKITDYEDAKRIDYISDSNELASIIFDTIDDFLLQFNGTFQRYSIFSDDEIYNLIAQSDNEDDVAEIVAEAVAQFLVDNLR